MASIVQFVDQVSASPTVRLDLNARPGGQGLMVAVDGIDLSPPPLRRATVSTMMSDGETVSAAAYGNRVLKIPLHLVAATADAGATILQTLARELVRPNNIIKMQLHGATSPVFFRTYAAPDYVLSMLRLMPVARTSVTLEIQAEPFALGLKETIAPVTVTEDPASGTNPMRWDITGVKGDVETPLVLTLPTGNLYDSGDPISVLSIRRRGTVANVPFFVQGESMTLGTDTTLPGNDANMSGSGSNYARSSFGTNASMVRRVYLDTFPTSINVDSRGRYRVFALLRRSSASGAIGVQLGYTASGSPILVQNDEVATDLVTARCHVDLGLISFPTGLDPVTDGYSGAELAVKGRYVEVRAARYSGSSNLDIDYLLFVPADDQLAMIDWGDALSTSDEFVVDGVHEMVYTQTTSDEVYGSLPAALSGGFPTISPGVTNRVYWIRRTGRGATVTKSETSSIAVSYWPRYLFIRPAST